MRNLRNFFLWVFIISYIVCVVGGLFWANYNFTRRVPGGVDFLVPWKGMQNFMMQGVTPYGDLTRLNIQSQIYNREILPGEYPYRVNLPFQFLILYLPFSWVSDFAIARAIWLILLELSLVSVIAISLRIMRWNPNWLFLILIFLSGVFWLPSVAVLHTGSSILLQLLVFVLALLAAEMDADELAGVLAAFMLVNLEATGFVFLGFLIWIISTGRQRILAGMGMMLVILFALSFILLPTWPFPFFAAMLANIQSSAQLSTYALFTNWLPGIGQRLAQLISAGALAVIFIEWRAVRGQSVRWLFWTSCLTFSITPLLGIPITLALIVSTLPGVILVISVMVQRWGIGGVLGAVITLFGLFAGLWFFQLNRMPSFFVLFYPIIMTILLYWVRWGAIRPARLWAEELRLRG